MRAWDDAWDVYLVCMDYRSNMYQILHLDNIRLRVVVNIFNYQKHTLTHCTSFKIVKLRFLSKLLLYDCEVYTLHNQQLG